MRGIPVDRTLVSWSLCRFWGFERWLLSLKLSDIQKEIHGLTFWTLRLKQEHQEPSCPVACLKFWTLRLKQEPCCFAFCKLQGARALSTAEWLACVHLHFYCKELLCPRSSRATFRCTLFLCLENLKRGLCKWLSEFDLFCLHKAQKSVQSFETVKVISANTSRQKSKRPRLFLLGQLVLFTLQERNRREVGHQTWCLGQDCMNCNDAKVK